MVVSEEIKQHYNEGDCTKILTVSFPNLNYTVPTEDIYYESMELEESISEGDNFAVIGCIASKFAVSIRDFFEDVKGEKIVAVLSLEDVPDSDITLFTGFVDSVTLESNKRIKKLVAYDQLYALSDTDVANWFNAYNVTAGNINTRTFGDIWRAFLSEVNLPYVNTNLVTDSIVYKGAARGYYPTTLNALTLLKNVCQINGVFGIINREGYLEFRSLHSGESVEQVPYIRTMDYQEYTTNAINKVIIRSTEDDKGVSYNSGNNKYIVQGNIFMSALEDDIKYSVAQALYGQVAGMSYRPVQCTNNAMPWIELGANNEVQYTVYDFENSTSAQPAYRTLNFIILSRRIKGIQSAVDEFTSEGSQDQTEFVTDLGSQLSALKDSIDSIASSMSEGFYVYKNFEPIVLENSESGTLAKLVYGAEEGQTVIVHFESQIDIATTSAPQVTLKIEYSVNGNVLDYSPETSFVSGVHLLHLMHFFQSGKTPEELEGNILTINVTVTGGTLSISELNTFCYVQIQEGSLDEFELEITQEPQLMTYSPGQFLDLTGIQVCKVYYDNPEEAGTSVIDTSVIDTGAVAQRYIDVTDKCSFSPDTGFELTEEGDVEIIVTYKEYNEVGELRVYTASLTVTVEDEMSDLEYVEYVLDHEAREVLLLRFKAEEIIEDEPDEVYIPSQLKVGELYYRCVIC